MMDPSGVQFEELTTLPSIYGEDWRLLEPKKTAWNTKGDLWWEIRIRGEPDDRIGVTLKGRFPPLYPHSKVIFDLIEPQNLAQQDVTALKKLLEKEANSLAKKGEVMVYEMVELARTWINENHVKPVDVNLHQAMTQKIEESTQAEEAQREAERRSEAAREAEVARELREKIAQSQQLSAERAKQQQEEEAQRRRLAELSILADGELETRVLELAEAVKVQGYDGSWKQWCLFAGRRDDLWTTYTAEPDPAAMSPANDTNGSAGWARTTMPTTTVHVVDFANPYYSTSHGRKKIESLVHDVSRLRDIRSPNVVPILAVQRGKSPRGFERVYIMTQLAKQTVKLGAWLPKNGFDESEAREYLEHMLLALRDIHRAKATQKQIDLDNTVISSEGGDRILQLSGTSYARRIGDLHLSNPFLQRYQSPIPEMWASPDEQASPHDYSTRRDVWHAGLLFLQMLFGSHCLMIYPNLEVLFANMSGVSSSTMDLVRALFHLNPKKRPSAEEAIERLRAGPLDEASESHTRQPELNRSLSSHTQGPYDIQAGAYAPSRAPPGHSQYKHDYVEVEFLGKGGFGEVVKARSRLDERVSAIKKIKMRDGDELARVMREVKSMAQINHPHCVKYFSCWLENVQPPAPEPEAIQESESDSTETETDTENEVDRSNTPSENSNPRLMGFIPADDPMFQPNFDQSFGRPDYSRSASLPAVRNSGGVHFGDDDTSDDDDDNSESDSDDSQSTVPDPSSRPRPGRGKAVAPTSHAKPSMSVTGTTSQDDNVKTILYISMEYVENQTLKELILQGIPEKEGWVLLTQILDALAHLASHKIVHRDLKPTNILITARGQAKIADFGLSTTDITPNAGTDEALARGMDHGIRPPFGAHLSSAVLASPSSKAAIEYDLTSNIGTGLYIAPEVAVSRNYDEKADMYSLGIIFFEMCWKFPTLMERAQTLPQLRSPSITFPTAWLPGNMVNQRKVIIMLLQHDPAKRPTAEQLLSDPVIPKSESETARYANAITELSNPASAHYPDLMRALFNRDRFSSVGVDSRLHDYTYDHEVFEDLQVWLTVITHRLVQLFQRHGAVEIHLPLLIPDTHSLSPFHSTFKPARLLDPNGIMVRLPTHNLLAMARNATRRQLERHKRYHVGERYNEHQQEGQPKSFAELTFDIISPFRSPAAEAEILDVVDKVLAEFKGARNPAFADYELHISHEGVLATILEAVPERPRADLERLFQDVGAVWSTDKKARLARLPIARHTLDELEQNCCIADDFAIVKRKLLEMFTTNKSRSRLTPALDELEAIIRLADAAGVKRNIIFRPTLARHPEMFRGGFFFEVVKAPRGIAKKPSSSQREVLAWGGRFDCLLEHFKAPSRVNTSGFGTPSIGQGQMPTLNKKVYGVGFCLATDLMARTVKKYELELTERLMNRDVETERSFGFWTPSRCDVYVVASGLDLAGRMAITGELWRAGVRCDLQYDDGRTLIEVEKECMDQNTLFLVLPRANKQIVKVRSILRKGGNEVEVPRQELTSHLRQAILEQRRIDAGHAGIEAPSLPGTVAMHTEPRGIEYDKLVKLVIPEYPLFQRNPTAKQQKSQTKKHRASSKNIYMDKACAFLQSTTSTLPLIGVDLTTDLLSRMTNDTRWVNEDDAWRALTSEMHGESRKYADSVRQAVQAHKAAGGAAQKENGGPGLGHSHGHGHGAGSGSAAAGQGGGGGWLWLYCVREAKGFLLQL